MRKIIIILMLVMLLNIGCRSNDEPTTLPQEDIHKGKTGVKIEFLKNTPPRSVYHDQPFSMGIMLSNIGAADITNGKISLSVEDEYISITESDWILPEENSIRVTGPKTAEYDLGGRNPSYPEGDMISFSIGANAKKLEEQSAIHKVDMILMTCYDYDSKLSTDVCIDFDIYDEKMDKACTPKDQSFSSGQGGPMAVVSVEPELLAQDGGGILPVFLIKVRNVGDGYPYTLGQGDYVCSSEPRGTSVFNEVDIAAQLGGVDLECSPSSTLRLKDKEDYVRCQTTVPWYQQDASQGSFMTSLVVRLSYGYVSSISRSLEIKRFPD